MDGNYVIMLKESLEKKVAILDKIILENEKQKAIFCDPNADPDELELTIEEKGKYIDQLDGLDQGFSSLFAQVEQTLKTNRPTYAREIASMKALIEQITDRSARITAQEKENYDLAKEKFSSVKENIQKVSKSHQVVDVYYKNMMKVNYLDPQFMDNKK